MGREVGRDRAVNWAALSPGSPATPQVPDLDVLVVPVSGGGMISGIALAAKAIKPGIKAREGRLLRLLTC